MTQTCIICLDKPAGSHEHVFPAALGGRRTNTKIYCELHNNGFGRHVAELEKQLSMFNAILQVRPDRRDAPKPFVLTDKDNNNLSMLGRNIETAPPPSLSELGHQHGSNINLKFSSLAQYEKWKNEQKKNGWSVQLKSAPTAPHSQHFIDPLVVSLSFGGFEALQAVGYLGLTFFAHFYPDEAREEGFQRFKDFLKLDFSNDDDKLKWQDHFVRWDGRDMKYVVGENPFRFGHAVAIGISGKERRAYAYISLFSTLNFSIDLGPVEKDTTETVRVYIDPKAEKAPHDWQCSRTDSAFELFGLSTPGLKQMIHSGNAEASLQRFLNQVGEWHFERFVEELVTEISAQKNLLRSPQQFAEELVEKNSQRVLNLLCRTATELGESLKNTAPSAGPIIEFVLSQITQSDETGANGLSTTTNAALVLAKGVIANALSNELSLSNPDAEKLALLLDGGPGMILVTEYVIQPLLSSAFRN